MDKKYIYAGIGIAVLLLLILTLPKYFSGKVTDSSIEISGEIEKIEIYHFHGTNQCASCIAVGNMAEETINTYFSDELKSGKITFNHINAQLPESYNLAKKYEVTGSSLWIGTYFKDGTFQKEENINVWYKINNKKEYINYLKGVIKSKLLGE